MSRAGDQSGGPPRAPTPPPAQAAAGDMGIPHARPLAAGGADNWHSLWLLNVYRLFLNFSLLAMFFLGSKPQMLGSRDPQLFSYALLGYLLASLIFASLVQVQRPRFDTQLYLQVYLDIIALVVLMHSSGGVDTGLGMLLVATVAGTGLIRADRFALLFAALGSLAVLGEQLYTQLRLGYDETDFMQAGLLGATLFATALLALVLARRSEAIEVVAQQRAIDLENLAELNEQVIQQMDAGLLFVDPTGRIRLANGSARELLGVPSDGPPPRTLADACEPLAESLSRWQGLPAPQQAAQQPGPLGDPRLRVELKPSFTALGDQGTLIHIEDHSFIRQQLQQLKLASIGRLTASIAHEIRNPLGAISHAAQLIDESPELNFADKRLTGIVLDNCRRMNAIIEDVLQLSRREKVEQSQIELRAWLTRFIREFCATEGAEQQHFSIDAPAELRAYMDPNHLNQVLWNLCSNALRHGGRDDLHILLRTERLPRSGQIALDVLDNGVGIGAEQAEEIFEPFVTFSHEGTGLGLYIARELCEFNSAALRLMPSQRGTHFRITFAPPQEVPGEP